MLAAWLRLTNAAASVSARRSHQMPDSAYSETGVSLAVIIFLVLANGTQVPAGLTQHCKRRLNRLPDRADISLARLKAAEYPNSGVMRRMIPRRAISPI